MQMQHSMFLSLAIFGTKFCTTASKILLPLTNQFKCSIPFSHFSHSLAFRFFNGSLAASVSFTAECKGSFLCLRETTTSEGFSKAMQ
jgi:hypothetical protein